MQTMTDRERLIELLRKAFEFYIDDPYCTPDETEFADYLLKNGVVVLMARCKDCVYLREGERTKRIFCTYHGDAYEFETLPNCYCSNGVGLAKGV